MSPGRILNEKQERDVAIAYLCGVNPDFIRKKWKVAQSTIIATIINNRSYEWHDPLLEYYRPNQRSSWNFAHFWLAYENVAGVEIADRELIDLEKDRDIYGAVMEDIIGGMEEEIAGDSGLKHFVEPHSGIERLLNDIFGIRTVHAVLFPIIFPRIHEKYLEQTEFSINRVTREIKTEVIYKLKHGALTITPLKEELFFRALHTLSAREALILGLRYGIKSDSILRLEQIGRCLELTRERVRQIEEKAIKKMGQGDRSKILRPLYHLTLDADALPGELK